jgi:hypothetical protein
VRPCSRPKPPGRASKDRSDRPKWAKRQDTIDQPKWAKRQDNIDQPKWAKFPDNIDRPKWAKGKNGKAPEGLPSGASDGIDGTRTRGLWRDRPAF